MRRRATILLFHLSVSQRSAEHNGSIGIPFNQFLNNQPIYPDEMIQQRQVEFEWIGAPEYVEPIYIKCLETILALQPFLQ